MKRTLITRKILPFLLLAFCQLGLHAQESSKYQWFNPAESANPVVQGRGWNTSLADFYDRLPQKAQSQVRPAVWSLSKNSAGEYIDFKTSATEIVVRYKVKGGFSMAHMPSTGVSGVDLYARDVNGSWQWARGSYSFGDTIEYRFRNLRLSAREEEFRLYLPLYNSVSWLSIGVAPQAKFTFMQPANEKPIVAYGTSIMQGACASRSGLAWLNILGRKVDRPVINLGFSGNGQLEKPLIDLMIEQDARLYILDCMPNLIRHNKLTKEEISRRIVESVKSLQTARPGVPILLTEHSGGIAGADIDTALVNDYKNSSLILSETFDLMKQQGISNIYLLSDSAIGMDLESTVDGTHPNDIGMMKHAEAYEKIIRQILVEEKGSSRLTQPVRQRRDYSTYDFMQRHEAVIKTVNEKQPKLVLMGNSITHFWGGQPEAGINRGAKSWVKYFEPMNAVNLGFGWDRIENVLWRVHHGELDGYRAGKIILTIGTNNLSIGDTDGEIIAGLEHLLNTIRQKQPSAQLFLSGIYPRRDYEERIKGLNKQISHLAKKLNVEFINPGVVLLNGKGKIDESLFSDGLHPNEGGYEKLAQVIVKAIK